MKMITEDCREDWQNCINALAFGRCALHGDGLTDAERIERDHGDALLCNERKITGANHRRAYFQGYPPRKEGI